MFMLNPYSGEVRIVSIIDSISRLYRKQDMGLPCLTPLTQNILLTNPLMQIAIDASL